MADQPAPVEVAGTTADWTAVSAGGQHTCARKTTGRLYCWGLNIYGQIGIGTFVNQDTPVEVAGGATDWATVDTGRNHTCARKSTGRAFCWGHDATGQLGDAGTLTKQLAPAPVVANPGTADWSQVSAGGFHTCARTTTGRLCCWGADGSGQLGNGGPDTDTSAPVEVAGATTTWASVSASYLHTCARKTTGRLYCWGADGSGRLGDGGTDTDQPAPVEVAGGATDWSSVTAGAFHTCARKTTRRLYCWGYDEHGQAGAPNIIHVEPAEVVGATTDWLSVDAGVEHTCALRTSRRLYCWGVDGNGQLGDGGPNLTQHEPVEVA